MPYLYRNHNTGDEVEVDERSVRLDHLDNWELVGEDEPPEQTGNKGKGYGEQTGGELELPVRSASKAAWKAYAIARGMAEADADKASRDALAARYHEEDNRP